MRSLAIVVAILMWADVAFADVIYEFREAGSTQTIGTLAIKSPPASAGMGWGTVDSSDLSAVLLDNGFFGLGASNLLFAGSLGFGGMTSVDGSKLDSGSVQIDFPIIAPPDPRVDPSIHKVLNFTFDSLGGADRITLASFQVFPDGSTVIGDLFLAGDWVAHAVPEPGTFALFAVGAASLGYAGHRKRRAL